TCRACHLWQLGTQTVFGEGTRRARLMLIGEKPGDAEDREGTPFVGPAGKLLDGVLGEAGIDRSAVYLTNVVKHFKWRPSGGGARRIHDKPNWTEIGACLPWLQAEIQAVEPELLVCLGATAAQAVIARDFKVTRERGTVVDSRLGVLAVATVHPSSVLRAPDEKRRREGRAALVADLRVAAQRKRRRYTSIRSSASG
ncbi:MAG: UdgX family uracil-DNA binding protein, partial [Geminicoccaceae bacterium]